MAAEDDLQQGTETSPTSTVAELPDMHLASVARCMEVEPMPRANELWPPPCWPGHICKKSLLQLRDGGAHQLLQPPYMLSVRYDLRPIMKQMGEKSAYLVLLDGEALRRIGRGSGLDILSASRSWIARDAMCAQPQLLARSWNGKLNGEITVQPEPRKFDNGDGVLLLLVMLTPDFKNAQLWEAACDVLCLRLGSPPVSCGLCQEVVPQRDLTRHQHEQCPQVFAECPKCMGSVHVRELAKHLSGDSCVQTRGIAIQTMPPPKAVAREVQAVCNMEAAEVQTEYVLPAPQRLHVEELLASLSPFAVVRWTAPAEELRHLCLQYRLSVSEYRGDGDVLKSLLRVEHLEVAQLQQRDGLLLGEFRHEIEQLRPATQYRLGLQAVAPDGSTGPPAYVVVTTLGRLNEVRASLWDVNMDVDAQITAGTALLIKGGEALDVRDATCQAGMGYVWGDHLQEAGCQTSPWGKDVGCQFQYITPTDEAACQALIPGAEDAACQSEDPVLAEQAIQCGHPYSGRVDAASAANVPEQIDAGVDADLELDSLGLFCPENGSLAALLRQIRGSELFQVLLVIAGNSMAIAGILLADSLPEEMWPMIASLLVMVFLNGIELFFFEAMLSDKARARLRLWRQRNRNLNRAILSAVLLVTTEALHLYRAVIRPDSYRFASEEASKLGSTGASQTASKGSKKVGGQGGADTEAPKSRPPQKMSEAQHKAPPPAEARDQTREAPDPDFQGVLVSAGARYKDDARVAAGGFIAKAQTGFSQRQIIMANEHGDNLAAKCPACNHYHAVPGLSSLWRNTRSVAYCSLPQLVIASWLLERELRKDDFSASPTLPAIHATTVALHSCLLLLLLLRWAQYGWRVWARVAKPEELHTKVLPEARLVHLRWDGLQSQSRPCDAWLVSWHSVDDPSNLRVEVLRSRSTSAPSWCSSAHVPQLSCLELQEVCPGHYFVQVQPWRRRGGLSMPVAEGHCVVPTTEVTEDTDEAPLAKGLPTTKAEQAPLAKGLPGCIGEEGPRTCDASTDPRPLEVADAATDSPPVPTAADAAVNAIADVVDAATQRGEDGVRPLSFPASGQLRASTGTNIGSQCLHVDLRPCSSTSVKGLCLDWAPHGLMEMAPRLEVHARRMHGGGRSRSRGALEAPAAPAGAAAPAGSSAGSSPGSAAPPPPPPPPPPMFAPYSAGDAAVRVTADLGFHRAFFPRLELGTYELVLSTELGTLTAEVIKCPHVRCGQHMWTESLADHVQQCPYRGVLCSNAAPGCRWTGCFIDLEEHLSSDCKRRPRPCRYCEQGCVWIGQAEAEPAHAEKCPRQVCEDRDKLFAWIAKRVEEKLNLPSPDYHDEELLAGTELLKSLRTFVPAKCNSPWEEWREFGNCQECNKAVDRKEKGLHCQKGGHWICWGCVCRLIDWDKSSNDECMEHIVAANNFLSRWAALGAQGKRTYRNLKTGYKATHHKVILSKAEGIMATSVLKVKPACSMATLIVTISTLDGQVLFDGERSRTDTILSLKKKIQESSGWSVDCMKLVWNSAVLQPNHAELGALVGESQVVDAILVKLTARRVYFDGISWQGHGAPEVTAGVSAKGIRYGGQITNKPDKDPFLRHVVDGGVKFESLTNPDLYIRVKGTELVLGPPDGNTEIFREIPALNGAPEPCITLESQASPERGLKAVSSLEQAGIKQCRGAEPPAASSFQKTEIRNFIERLELNLVSTLWNTGCNFLWAGIFGTELRRQTELAAECAAAEGQSNSTLGTWLPTADEVIEALRPMLAEVHQRGRDQWHGHPLHFDTNEQLLRDSRGSCVQHPAVSTVVYLCDDSPRFGPTLVTDQRLGDSTGKGHATLVEPRLGRALFFDGGYLHGAMPGKPWLASPLSPERRLNLMVGWWTSDISTQAPADPPRPLMRTDPAARWVKDFACQSRAGGTTTSREEGTAAAAAQSVEVRTTSPTWVDKSCAASRTSANDAALLFGRFFLSHLGQIDEDIFN
ncbi:unnamed protein product [Polarella glacialis]|uniref:Uncharacterized protein n=1 Tax=Polarella glacialis TaxID=89957 RepID=A0A813HAT3_POLGL|nr:unnamed protein product [Polarella glacialis]